MTFPTATQAHNQSTANASANVETLPIYAAVSGPILDAISNGLFSARLDLLAFNSAVIARVVTYLTNRGYTVVQDVSGQTLTVSW